MLWLLSSDDSSCKLRWAKDVPASIQPLVNGGIAYLRTYLLSGQFSLGNAFFSGSEKVLSLPSAAIHTNTRDRFIVVTNPLNTGRFHLSLCLSRNVFVLPVPTLLLCAVCAVCVVCCVCVVCVVCVLTCVLFQRRKERYIPQPAHDHRPGHGLGVQPRVRHAGRVAGQDVRAVHRPQVVGLLHTQGIPRYRPTLSLRLTTLAFQRISS